MRPASILILALAVVSLHISHTAAATAPPPNIVFILADDLGYGDLSCLNPGSKIKTPNLDRLAATGMIFTDAHSPSAVCTPTRYGVLTGRYAWRTRLKRGVLDGFSPPLLEPGRMTVARMLQQKGYSTACVGKWHLGLGFSGTNGAPLPEKQAHPLIDYNSPLADSPREHGFGYSFIIPASLDMPPYVYIRDGRVLRAPTATMTGRKGQHMIRPGPMSPGFHQAQVLPEFTREATEYIARAASVPAPFFLYLALNSPHTPVEPLPEFAGRSAAGTYGDFVMQTDHAVGEVMAALARAGVTTNTLVIFTSDNGSSPAGFPLDDERALGHATSHIYRGRKSDAWEGGHRVPFLASWPSRIKPASTSSQTIALTDFFSTAAEIVGHKPPADAGEDSLSILPALLARGPIPADRSIVHHSINGTFALRQGPWKYIECRGSGGWTLSEKQASHLPAVQLYNLAEDPGETRNLESSHPEIRERLRRNLEALRSRDLPVNSQ